MEYIDSKAISFGAFGLAASSNSRKCPTSLCRNTCFSHPELRMPAIMEAWFNSSEKMMQPRSEEHTSELQSLMRISYAVFCLKQKKEQRHHTSNSTLISDTMTT